MLVALQDPVSPSTKHLSYPILFGYRYGKGDSDEESRKRGKLGWSTPTWKVGMEGEPERTQERWGSTSRGPLPTSVGSLMN